MAEKSPNFDRQRADSPSEMSRPRADSFTLEYSPARPTRVNTRFCASTNPSPSISGGLRNLLKRRHFSGPRFHRREGRPARNRSAQGRHPLEPQVPEASLDEAPRIAVLLRAAGVVVPLAAGLRHLLVDDPATDRTRRRGCQGPETRGRCGRSGRSKTLVRPENRIARLKIK